MKNLRRRRFSLEKLETREVLAGAVQAEIVGGSLVVRGDSEGNYIAVWQGADDQVVVAGLKPSGGFGLAASAAANSTETLVNGSRNAVRLSGFVGGVRLEMNGGSDRVIVTNAHVRGSLQALLGGGDDLFALTSVSAYPFQGLIRNNLQPIPFGDVVVDGVTQINLDDGRDDASVVGATLHGDLTMNGGRHNDYLSVIGARTFAPAPIIALDALSPPVVGETVPTVVNGNVALNGEGGDDGAVVQDAVIEGNLTVNDTNAANYSSAAIREVSVEGDINVFTGKGTDFVSIAGGFFAPAVSTFEGPSDAVAFTARNVRVSTGEGDDYVTVFNGRMANLNIDTGGGNDGNGEYFGIDVYRVEVDSLLTIRSGAGLDNVLLELVEARDLRIDTGDQSDGLILWNVDAFLALLNTGGDGDVLGIENSSFDILDVQLGDGDDSAAISGTEVPVVATFDGGAGVNVLNRRGGNKFARLVRNRI